MFSMAFGSVSVLTFSYFLLLQGIESLRLLEVKIPQHAVRDQDAHLECRYELRGESLYSVKWYKDGHEFFRYIPKDNPPAQVFKLPGVTVSVSNSSESTVVLSKVDLSSSGRYRCEVSGEAPEFRTVTDHGEMIVVALPEEGPKISGGKPRYQIGDTVNLNCTSGSSNPPAQLDWFINGEKADPSFLRGPHTMFIGGDELQKTILGLQFRVNAKHFKDGDMKLKCLASISTIYWKTNEESVKGDKPLIKVMSSQDTSLPNKSRADRVQAYGAGCRPNLSPLLIFTTCGLFSVLTKSLTSFTPREFKDHYLSDYSLLEGCQNIFEKGNESWKSYFSKWETLAELEEDLPEKIEEKAIKKQKSKSPPLKNTKAAKKKVIRRKKGGKNKKKTEENVIERSRESANENLPEERDNNQLEMHLRTIFMDILKANKNKWEVFVVLSRTFSHRDETIKKTRLLEPNHQLALSSELSKKDLLFGKVEVISSNPEGEFVNLQGFEFFHHSLCPASAVGKNEPLKHIASPTENNAFKQFKLWMGKRQYGRLTSPSARTTIFNFNSCSPSLQNIPHHEKIKLHPLALDYRHDRTPKSCSKTNNEYLCERNIPEVNITREEKRFGSLCLHKRTNGVGLNIENSNFITPERNSSERKCFSENISQRKRRRPAKLFFDFWDELDSENEEEGQRLTPRIGWQSKTRKTVTPEAVAVESDSESDSIFDRVKKV